MEGLTTDVRMAIADLNADYASCLDERRDLEWPDFFSEDGTYGMQARAHRDHAAQSATLRLVGIGMLRDHIRAVTQSPPYAAHPTRHIVGWPRVWIDGDGVLAAEANYIIVRGRDEEPPLLFSAGRYLDRIVRVDGRLKFRERLCICDGAYPADPIVYPL